MAYPAVVDGRFYHENSPSINGVHRQVQAHHHHQQQQHHHHHHHPPPPTPAPQPGDPSSPLPSPLRQLHPGPTPPGLQGYVLRRDPQGGGGGGETLPGTVVQCQTYGPGHFTHCFVSQTHAAVAGLFKAPPAHQQQQQYARQPWRKGKRFSVPP